MKFIKVTHDSADSITIAGGALHWFIRPTMNKQQMTRSLSMAAEIPVESVGLSLFKIRTFELDGELAFSEDLSATVGQDTQDPFPWDWYIQSTTTLRSRRKGSVGVEAYSSVPSSTRLGSVTIETSMTPSALMDIMVEQEVSKAGVAKSKAREKVEKRLSGLRQIASKLEGNLVACLGVTETRGSYFICPPSNCKALITPTGTYAVGTLAIGELTTNTVEEMFSTYVNLWEYAVEDGVISGDFSATYPTANTELYVAQAAEALEESKAQNASGLSAPFNPLDMYVWYSMIRVVFQSDGNLNKAVNKMGYPSIMAYLQAGAENARFVAVAV